MNCLNSSKNSNMYAFIDFKWFVFFFTGMCIFNKNNQKVMEAMTLDILLLKIKQLLYNKNANPWWWFISW